MANRRRQAVRGPSGRRPDAFGDEVHAAVSFHPAGKQPADRTVTKLGSKTSRDRQCPFLAHCSIKWADSSGGCNTRGLSGLPWPRWRLLRLSRGVEQFDDLLAGFHEPEGFAWPVVEFLGDRVEVVLRVDG